LLAHPIVQRRPFCTSDAPYGGRTEAMRHHYKARENETIHYVDVMSLYPHICNYFKFPVAHPVIHVGDACKDKETSLRMDGLIKFSFVSPEMIYHSVLPFRCNNKLLLWLCRMCGLKSSSSEECVHTRG